MSRPVAEHLCSKLVGNRLLHHVTPAARLPDILASGALLPPAMMKGSVRTHGWGANADLGPSLVCLALMPNWGMIRTFGGEEVVILSFEPADIRRLAAIRVTPCNSATRDARQFLTGRLSAEDSLRRCLQDEAWRQAEVVCAGPVPTSALRVITFCDTECQERWEEVCQEAISSAADAIHPRLRWQVASNCPPRFPPHLEVTTRVAVAAGRDRRIAPNPWVEPKAHFDLDSIDWFDQDDPKLEAQGDGDLFDQLYAAPPAHSLEDFYGDVAADDESLHEEP